MRKREWVLTQPACKGLEQGQGQGQGLWVWQVGPACPQERSSRACPRACWAKSGWWAPPGDSRVRCHLGHTGSVGRGVSVTLARLKLLGPAPCSSEPRLFLWPFPKVSPPPSAGAAFSPRGSDYTHTNTHTQFRPSREEQTWTANWSQWTPLTMTSCWPNTGTSHRL